MGYVELNPLYQILGVQYWTFNVIVTVAFPIIVLEFGNRWAFLAMLAPTVTRSLASVNNLMLLMGVV